METVLLPFKLNTFESENLETICNWVSDVKLPIAAQQTITRVHLATRIHWHAASKFSSMSQPHFQDLMPKWWSAPGDFGQFPALRQVSVSTTLSRCYCDKPKTQTDAMVKVLGESEEQLEGLIKASRKDTSTSDVDVVFERDLPFAPLGNSGLLILDDDEGDNPSADSLNQDPAVPVS